MADATIALVAYSLISWIMSVYLINYVYLIAVTIVNRKQRQANPTSIKNLPNNLPTVTIQLPIYNEMYVVKRLIDSVCNLEYPSEKLQIIIIDDSDDETRQVLDQVVKNYIAKGYDITLIRRNKRVNYKAGALQEALKISKGELIAIFDADFVPNKDFLIKLVPYFSLDRVGMVQARWSHLNEDYSSLTKAQALSLDLHFSVEHVAKMVKGYMLNFNGSAGIWRKECIIDAGGWDFSLAEDLDLSYRAQLKGWKCIVVNDVKCPAELPVQVNASKKQQSRWAMGAIMCSKKLLKKIMGSNLPLGAKIQAFLQLTRHIPQVLLIFQFIMTMPLISLINPIVILSWLVVNVLLTLYIASFIGKKNIARKLSSVVYMLLFNIGISLNNTIAVIKELIKGGSEFVRTPKFGIVGNKGVWRGKRYVVPFIMTTVGELALASYGIYWIAMSIILKNILILPYVILITSSFLYVSIMTIVHSVKVQKPLRLEGDTVSEEHVSKFKRSGKKVSGRMLTYIIIALILLSMVVTYYGYVDTIYMIEKANAWLNRAETAGFAEDLISYIEQAIPLLPNSGNPVWMFPTKKTDFTLIRKDLDMIVERAKILTTIPRNTDAYQQGMDDLRGKLKTLQLQLKEAAPFMFFSLQNIALAALMVIVIIVLIYLKHKI